MVTWASGHGGHSCPNQGVKGSICRCGSDPALNPGHSTPLQGSLSAPQTRLCGVQAFPPCFSAPEDPPPTREAPADERGAMPRPVRPAWGFPREGPAALPASLGHGADSPESREAPKHLCRGTHRSSPVLGPACAQQARPHRSCYSRHGEDRRGTLCPAGHNRSTSSPGQVQERVGEKGPGGGGEGAPVGGGRGGSTQGRRGGTRHPCAHLSSWKLATPRWRKPTAMQVSLVNAWSNAWGQRGPRNAKVCHPITPCPSRSPSR